MAFFKLTDTQIIIAYRGLIDKHELGITNKCADNRYGHSLFIKYSLFSLMESGKIVGIS